MRAGIDRQQWYRIENGKSGTKRDTVIAIAKAISVDLDEAFRRAGYAANPKRPTNAAEFLEALEAMGIEQFQRFEGAPDNLTPDEYEQLLQSVRLAIDLTLHRRRK